MINVAIRSPFDPGCGLACDPDRRARSAIFPLAEAGADVRRRPACLPLAALARDVPADAAQFRRWRGRSGRAYIVRVHPLSAFPDSDGAVVLAVDGRRGTCVWIGQAGEPGVEASLAAAARAGADELHVHLLAGDAAARAFAIRDLDARH